MATKFDQAAQIEEALAAAANRVQLPPGQMWCRYDAEADVLSIKLVNPATTTHSDFLDNGVVVNYDANHQVVGYEIMNALGTWGE